MFGKTVENTSINMVNDTVHEKKWQAGFKLSKTLPHLIKSALNTIYILISKQVLESYYQKMRQIIFFRVPWVND